MLDKLKLIFVVLQKGSELANAGIWKNTAAAIQAVVAVLAAAFVFLPVEIPAEITAGIAAGVVGVVQLVQLYLTFATSKRVGLPGIDATDLVAAQTGGQPLAFSDGRVAGLSVQSVISSGAWAKFVTVIKLAWYVIPKLNALILLAEAAFPGASRGKEKLEFVRVKIMAIYDRVAGTKLAFDSAWPDIAKKIAEIVAAWNSKSWPALPAVQGVN